MSSAREKRKLAVAERIGLCIYRGMSSWRRCQIIGDRGVRIVMKFIQNWLDERGKGETARLINDIDDNRRFGDIVFAIDGIEYSLESKAELLHSPRLFLETYSNKKRRTPGWFYTTEANLVSYLFLESNILHIMNMISFKRWAKATLNLDKYPGIPAERNGQPNDPHGRLPSFEEMRRIQEIDLKTYDVSQLGKELWPFPSPS